MSPLAEGRGDGDVTLNEAHNVVDRLAAVEPAKLAEADDATVVGVVLDIVLLFGMIGISIAEYLRDIRGSIGSLSDRP